MEKGPNFSDKPEKATDKKDGKSKYVPKKIGSAIPLAAEKTPTRKESDTEERRILAESVLGKLTGESEENTKKTEQAEKPKDDDSDQEADTPEASQETSDAGHEEAAAESPAEFAETLEDQSAHRMAEDLAEGQEISLRDAEQVPVERDPNIISEALDLAEQADMTNTQEMPDPPAVSEVANEDIPELELERDAAERETQEAPRPVFELPVEQQENSSEQEESTLPNGVAPPTPPIPPAPTASFGAERPMPEYMTPRPVSAQEQSSNEIRQIAEDAAWGERQKGRREGVLAGMLLGGGIEHFRHKRRERKAEKQRKQAERVQEKRIEKLESDYTQAREAQVAERVTHTRELAEQKQAQQITEQEQLKKAQEQQIEQSEQLAVPEGHHIEQSAWHSIEVDEQGRAVEDGAIAYGHEYYEERRHESAPKDIVHEAAGEVALVAAALHDDPHDVLPDPRATYPTQAASGHTPMSEPPQKKTALQAITTPPSTPAGTLGWLLVLALLVVVLILVAR